MHNNLLMCPGYVFLGTVSFLTSDTLINCFYLDDYIKAVFLIMTNIYWPNLSLFFFFSLSYNYCPVQAD